jgi:hypothetical protein
MIEATAPKDEIEAASPANGLLSHGDDGGPRRHEIFQVRCNETAQRAGRSSWRSRDGPSFLVWNGASVVVQKHLCTRGLHRPLRGGVENV